MKSSSFSLLFLLAGSLVVAEEAAAATYYVCGSAAICNSGTSGWSSGNNSNNCTSKTTPCASTSGVEAKMSSGDTAIFGNGSYATPSCNLVYGSPTNGYTTIKAEQLGGVTMGGVNCQPSSRTRPAFWTFGGLLFTSNTIVANIDHIKFMRNGSSDGGSGNSANFAAGEGAN